MKTIVYIGTSLDGFIARKDGEFDWLTPFANDEAILAYEKLIDRIDAIVIGRGTFEKVLTFPVWPYKKKVFVLSTSLKDAPDRLMDQVTILAGKPKELLSYLEGLGYSTLYVDGGRVIQDFLLEDLIDELIISRAPVLIGSGIPLFGFLGADLHFKHVKTDVSSIGLVRSYYERESQMDYYDFPDARLYYKKRGAGYPIVFIHGFCLDHRMWENQLDFFSARYTAIAVDLRGHGRSSDPTGKPYSHHEDIHRLLSMMGINQPVILVGLSMGARVVSNYALTYPEQTRAIVFVDGIIDGYTCKDFDLNYIYAAAKREGIPVANELWLDHELFRTARKNPEAGKLLAEMVMSNRGWHWVNKNAAQKLDPPALEQLHKLTMPALIITGQFDIPDFQAIGELLHAGIAQSSRKEIAGAGHMCNMEMPGAFNETVSQFLEQITHK